MGFFTALPGFGRHQTQPLSQDPSKDVFTAASAKGSPDEASSDERRPQHRFSKTGAKSFSHARAADSEASQAGVSKRATIDTIVAPPVEYTSFDEFKNPVEIYKGSISSVYRAICKRTAAKVVVKMYHKKDMTPKQLHKLEREVEIQRRVTACPYVCQLFATFDTPDATYLVLESCEGGDLFKKMMKTTASVPERDVCVNVIVPLLRVLESLATLSIIHRDIKPENIFLTGGGSVKLGDFGLAIDTTTEIPFCRSGTLDYMAPEVLLNPCTRLEEQNATLDDLSIRKIVPYTAKVDVWATGVLAYELIMGHPPFEVENESETVGRILTHEDIEFDARFSPEWADFVRQALQKRPRKRPIASRLLEHPWVVKNLAEAYYGANTPRSRKAAMEKLLEPIPIYRIEPPAAASVARSPSSKVQFSAAADAVHEVEASDNGDAAAAADPMSTTARLEAATDPLRHLRPDRFGDGVGALGAGMSGLSFSRPAANYSTVGVQQLSAEEKGDTGAAVGMKARLQLHMSRQRT